MFLYSSSDYKVTLWCVSGGTATRSRIVRAQGVCMCRNATVSQSGCGKCSAGSHSSASLPALGLAVSLNDHYRS